MILLTEEIVGIVIGSVIFIGICLGSLCAYHGEKKDYNKGRCPRCWGKLRHFDNDSQGGRGHCCENGDYYTWVSYPGIEVEE